MAASPARAVEVDVVLLGLFVLLQLGAVLLLLHRRWTVMRNPELHRWGSASFESVLVI